MDMSIGMVQCLALASARGPDGVLYKAGVVRVRGENRIILVTVPENGEYLHNEVRYMRPADPSCCPPIIRTSPAFNAWEFASPLETAAILAGRIQT